MHINHVLFLSLVKITVTTTTSERYMKKDHLDTLQTMYKIPKPIDQLRRIKQQLTILRDSILPGGHLNKSWLY